MEQGGSLFAIQRTGNPAHIKTCKAEVDLQQATHKLKYLSRSPSTTFKGVKIQVTDYVNPTFWICMQKYILRPPRKGKEHMFMETHSVSGCVSRAQA
jgi:hypothetical protein